MNFLKFCYLAKLFNFVLFTKFMVICKDRITEEKLVRYFKITEKALKIAEKKIAKGREKEASQLLDMARRYYEDAKWFKNKKNYVDAFAAINYAHGWLDSGSRLGIFKVKNSKLFVMR